MTSFAVLDKPGSELLPYDSRSDCSASLNIHCKNNCKIKAGHMVIRLTTAKICNQHSKPSCGCKLRSICRLSLIAMYVLACFQVPI